MSERGKLLKRLRSVESKVDDLHIRIAKLDQKDKDWIFRKAEKIWLTLEYKVSKVLALIKEDELPF